MGSYFATQTKKDETGTWWTIVYGSPGKTPLLAMKRGVQPNGWDMIETPVWGEFSLEPAGGFGI